ncbi:MAG: nucleoside transporter C-terminal domain-containing protein [bacterium]
MINIIEYLMTDQRYMSLVGLVAILGVAFLFSKHKSKVRFRLVATALALQFLFAYFILNTDIGEIIFAGIARGFEALYQFADNGSRFVFGSLADASGPWGVVFAIKVIPTIIFFGALMAFLFHIGIVQLFVKGIAFVIRPLLGTSGAETLSVTASSMLGQTEAPLLVKNYLARMTDSEMFVIMVGGFCHLSGSLLAVYGIMGVPIKHLLSSTFIAIPGAILIAKILVPETMVPETAVGGKPVETTRQTKNILDAISQGTSDGLRLAVNVAAMLIAFISLIALVDAILLASVGFSLNDIFARAFYGVAYVIGVPAQDRELAGTLLGQKLAINEFVAYSTFIKAELLPRTKVIMTYALAGFANFSSIGIQIGGIGALCPEKRHLLTKLGLRALLGGTLVNLLNAVIAGLLI